MRIYVALAAAVVGFGVPTCAGAEDKVASFEERWPEAAMRKPTISELVYLVACALKQDIQTELEKERFSRQQTSRPCSGEICQLLNSP